MVSRAKDVGVLTEVQSLVDELLRIRGDDPHREGVAPKVAEVLELALQSPTLFGWLCEEAPKQDNRAELGFPLVFAPDRGYQAPHDHGPCWSVNATLIGAYRVRHYMRTGDGSASDQVVLQQIDESLQDPKKADCTDIEIAHENIPVSPRILLGVTCHSPTNLIQYRYDLEKGIYQRINRGTNEVLASGAIRVIGLA